MSYTHKVYQQYGTFDSSCSPPHNGSASCLSGIVALSTRRFEEGHGDVKRHAWCIPYCGMMCKSGRVLEAVWRSTITVTHVCQATCLGSLYAPCFIVFLAVQHHF